MLLKYGMELLCGVFLFGYELSTFTMYHSGIFDKTIWIFVKIKYVACEIDYSLYSTRTQNIWRWVLLRHLTQKIVLLRHLTQGYQHVGIFCVRRRKFFRVFYPTRNLKVVFYPTQNPNASQWNIGCVGCQRNIFASSMYISCFL